MHTVGSATFALSLLREIAKSIKLALSVIPSYAIKVTDEKLLSMCLVSL